MDNTKNNRRHTPMTTNKWIGVLFLLTIPLVNIWFLIYWAFIQKVSLTRRNFARGVLIWLVLLLLIFILTMIIFQPSFNFILNFLTNMETEL